jgi:chemotaxis protein CheY-P-specific phosphatase CheC
MVIDEIPGFTIDNQTTPVTLFKDLTTHVTLSNLQQVGGESGNQTTTALSFILDVEVGLTTANVNFTNSNITSIDALSHEVGTLYYEITISGV